MTIFITGQMDSSGGGSSSIHPQNNGVAQVEDATNVLSPIRVTKETFSAHSRRCSRETFEWEQLVDRVWSRSSLRAHQTKGAIIMPSLHTASSTGPSLDRCSLGVRQHLR